MTDIADAVGLITRFRDAKKDRTEPLKLDKSLESDGHARGKGRQLCCWTLTCNKNGEYVTRFWNRFYRLAEDLQGRILASPTGRSETCDVPILL